MNSDCRNRNLQKMFQMIGYADQAGSGFPKIYSGWASQDWKKPEFREDFKYRQTYLALRMTSLLPDDAVAVARTMFGERFLGLPQLERLAVVTAIAEEEITHSRLMELCTDHQTDISMALRNLVQAKILYSEGYGRGTIYHILQSNKSAIETNNGMGSSSVTRGPSSDIEGPSSDIEGLSSGLGGLSPEILNRGRRECLLLLLRGSDMSAATLRLQLKRNNATKFRCNILIPLIRAGFVIPTMQPLQHPRQKYRITDVGRQYMVREGQTPLT